MLRRYFILHVNYKRVNNKSQLPRHDEFYLRSGLWVELNFYRSGLAILSVIKVVGKNRSFAISQPDKAYSDYFYQKTKYLGLLLT